ncbi:TauD/TfdA family dioxygenase [Allokutzneria sp. A3M-2-11 16]|uniref:TauD/TfdA family dioxygenase n=1 Tax=Allokutzneria sp. A3M-2-11 16 TaxID=2962043 RepID=UPI0020B658E7|nr:TauD/TfdA family dioxygenase [Allokutzneria sp. A3M-2-11 16]MCP3803364.1 TauD/TfdA family dioxygenase [Allokutzneria sp. A3M-2-11 16]
MRVTTLPDGALPAVVEGAEASVGAAHELVAANRAELRELLVERGALLLRGFPGGLDELDLVVREFSGEALVYTERSSPRSTLKGNIYTSTDYPNTEEIFLHNEHSYQASWPHVLYFHCLTEPESRGATPLADIRQIHSAIDASVREEFARRQWMCVRNFHANVGVSWQSTFGTEDRDEVERYAAEKGIATEWRPGNLLRTRTVRPAIHPHPVTGEQVWFNHATFFNVTTLPAMYRDGLRDMFADEDLPTHTYYGDGEPIPDDVMEHLRECYRAASTRFDWRRGDTLIVDNMRAAHGREPYTGQRKIAVAMAEPSSVPSSEKVVT